MRVDYAGYNAIDHEVYSFVCTDGNWSGDPEKYFRWYEPNDMIAGLPQVKAWKNVVGKVDLVSTGGHEARFAGRRVYPKKFVMKHFGYRSPQQARRKIETRLARRCHEEHAKGWGVHYNAAFPAGFCWDPAKLQEFFQEVGCPA